MFVSQFEIYRLAQRALEGSGAPYGVDRDGARAVAWLEARGLPGLERLAADLPGLEGKFSGLVPPKDGVLDAGGLSALAYAGGVLDLWRARRDRKSAALLAIENCRSPIFLMAMAAVEGRELGLSWQAAGVDVCCRVAPDGGVRLAAGLGPGLVAALRAPGPTRVEIGVERIDAATDVLGPDELDRRHDLALRQGIAVDEDIWRAVDTVAARVQVPASDQSRLKGAGGGDANA